ncbi:MAG: hypothetical protein CMI02_07075 [Oceanospirillaceae bacterium]|nr:hypothetical protein [Oceanospirillaceae bacterium]MBT11779.1 hypothetical protein [Oceanospirillaceae bacterium]|tara:strand:- start:49510 stop:49827 length:318 start_codon:yes stop_codon:yes gene_type:complete
MEEKCGLVTKLKDKERKTLSSRKQLIAMEVDIRMTDLKDKEQEVARLHEEVERLEDEIHRISNKLNNEGFVSRVPAAMIEKEQKKRAICQKKQARLKEQLQAIEA